jgi:quinol monooxygenase YgiN
MLISIVRISASAGREDDIVDILQSVRGPTLASSGCLECSILEEREDEKTILYLERWRSPADMSNHIRSALYGRILKALELSEGEPQVSFYEIQSSQGMELVEKLRSENMALKGF